MFAGFFSVLLQRPRKAWLANHYYFMGWSYVGLMAATAAEIWVRVVHWPFGIAVAAPTLAITAIGGTLVQLLRQRTMRRLAHSRRSLNQP